MLYIDDPRAPILLKTRVLLLELFQPQFLPVKYQEADLHAPHPDGNERKLPLSEGYEYGIKHLYPCGRSSP